MLRLQGITLLTGILEGDLGVAKTVSFSLLLPASQICPEWDDENAPPVWLFFFIERWLGANRPLGGKRPNIPNAPCDWNIYLHENHKFEPNVGKYSIHGAYGLERTLTYIYIYQ